LETSSVVAPGRLGDLGSEALIPHLISLFENIALQLAKKFRRKAGIS